MTEAPVENSGGAAPSTPAAPVTPATPAAPAAPAAPVTPPANPTNPATPPADPAKPAEPSAYKIPDAHKDKPWAKNVKSEEDLYKELDGLSSLKGKKHIAPDFKASTPDEIEAYFATTRPADKTAYQFAEGADPAFSGSMADAMWEAGVSDYQFDKIKGAYDKLEASTMEKATSADGFKEVMSQNFGEKYDALVVQGQKIFKENLTPEQQKILDVMPNAYVAPLYQLVQKYEAKIEQMKKDYGVNENGNAHLENKGGFQPPDIGKVRSELRGKIRDIEARPHTAADKQKLVDDLQATYSNQQLKH